MATGQTLLDRMELLHPELQVQPGEDGVAKGLVAANMAQDYFESVLALYPQAFGDVTGTVETVPGQETSVSPSGLLRIDALWRLDANGRPVQELDLAQAAGGHAGAGRWPYVSGNPVSTGVPITAWTNGRQFFWGPIPDAIYTIRWYGLWQQADITVDGNFLYPDICLTPFATFAAKVIRIGLDDSAEQLDALATALFEPVIATMQRFRRDRPKTLTYSQVHTT